MSFRAPGGVAKPLEVREARACFARPRYRLVTGLSWCLTTGPFSKAPPPAPVQEDPAGCCAYGRLASALPLPYTIIELCRKRPAVLISDLIELVQNNRANCWNIPQVDVGDFVDAVPAGLRLMGEIVMPFGDRPIWSKERVAAVVGEQERGHARGICLKGQHQECRRGAGYDRRNQVGMPAGVSTPRVVAPRPRRSALWMRPSIIAYAGQVLVRAFAPISLGSEPPLHWLGRHPRRNPSTDRFFLLAALQCGLVARPLVSPGRTGLFEHSASLD